MRGGKTSKRMNRLSVRREAERFLPQGQQVRCEVVCEARHWKVCDRLQQGMEA